jgi:hypothetical protein
MGPRPAPLTVKAAYFRQFLDRAILPAYSAVERDHFHGFISSHDREAAMRIKSFRYKIAAALLALAGLGACASFPTPASDQDVLLVIPVKLTVASDSAGFGHYEMKIAPVAGGIHTNCAIVARGGCALITGLKPGTYRIVDVYFMYQNGKPGNRYPVGDTVVLESRTITILPRLFICKIYSENGHRGTTWSWGGLTMEASNEMAKTLTGEEGFKQWKLSVATLNNPYFRVAFQQAPGM